MLVLFLVLMVACQPGAPASKAPATATAAPELTATPPPTPTAIRTPPGLPGSFESKYLDPLDSPYTYVDDTCVYLRNKWDPAKAAPGTVVMIIMLHSINRRAGEGPEATTALGFAKMMGELHEQRFHAITMQQLAGFLEDNSRIPYRSVVLIQDQNHYPDNFNSHFRYYWETWGWPVVNALNPLSNIAESLWADYATLGGEGLVDFQVYGPSLDPAAKPSSDEDLTDLLEKPIEVLKERLDIVPTGVIWPNGFNAQAAGIARELGYRLGFTFNSRGPVMYNWVPLSESKDKQRPSYLPEASVGDPLMTLPRFWPYQVHTSLDAVRITGDDAAAYADTYKAVELEYYDIACEARYGPIPADVGE